MRKLTTGICVLAAAVAVPAAALGTPSHSETKNAAAFCKHLKQQSGGGAAYTQSVRTLVGGGSKVTDKNAYGKCVSSKAHQNATRDAHDKQTAHQNASQQCRQEQSDQGFADAHGGKTFDQFYGTNSNGRNAFGKCVSQHARANQQQLATQDQEQDQNEVNAARQCKAQSGDKTAFAQKWGSGRNAFGKCVSATAKQLNGEGGSGGSNGSDQTP